MSRLADVSAPNTEAVDHVDGRGRPELATPCRSALTHLTSTGSAKLALGALGSVERLPPELTVRSGPPAGGPPGMSLPGGRAS